MTAWAIIFTVWATIFAVLVWAFCRTGLNGWTSASLAALIIAAVYTVGDLLSFLPLS